MISNVYIIYRDVLVNKTLVVNLDLQIYLKSHNYSKM